MTKDFAQQSWMQLLCIQIGGAICLPVIITGQMLAQSYGLKAALGAILLGNLFLMVYAYFASSMATQERKATLEYVVGAFGEKGVHFFGAVFILTMLGWFAIQLNLMTESILHLLRLVAPALECSSVVMNLLLGAVMTVVSILGIRGMQFLSQVSLPLLVVTLGYALYGVAGTPVVSETIGNGFTAAGASLVIATAIAVVIDLPTYWRHAKTPSDGKVAALLLFGIALPLIEGVGVYLGTHSGGQTILETLSAGGGLFWSLWVALFLLLAGWTTNNGNLYSATVNSFATFSRLNFQQRTLLLGALGTALSCFDLLNHFAFSLEVMGILIGSMGAVIISSHYLKRARMGISTPLCVYTSALFGFLMGLGSLLGVFTLTTAPVLDAFLGSCLLNGLLSIRRSYEISQG